MVVPKNLRNGEEQYEHKVKTYIRYYYRDMDGRLFITAKPTLDECEAEKDKWLKDNKRSSMSLKPDAAAKEIAERRRKFLEYYDNGTLLLGIGAFPVSGDLKKENDESKEIKMNDKYDVTLDVTERGFDGSYSSQPHTYKKCFSSAEDAKAGINDLLWECIEIEGIASGRILVECSVEKNGEYFDSDESELEIAVELTDKPSRYFADNRSRIPMSVNRAKSSCFVIE